MGFPFELLVEGVEVGLAERSGSYHIAQPM
jgi:hypothetical protein